MLLQNPSQRACPKLNDKILRYAQNDMRRAQNDKAKDLQVAPEIRKMLRTTRRFSVSLPQGLFSAASQGMLFL